MKNQLNIKYLFFIVVLSASIKLVYFLFAIGVSSVTDNYDIESNKHEFVNLFKRNDSFWYEKVAHELYPKINNPMDLGYSFGKYYKQSSWAHFPAYPLCIRAVEKVTSLNFSQSCFILSLIFSSLSFLGFYFICIALFSKTNIEALKLTILFMVFPFHYYFSMYYTEALFFSCLAFSFIALHYKKYITTAFLLIPLTLVRPNGIVCVLPLALYFVEQHGGLVLYLKNWNVSKLKHILIFISAPLALLAYCLYQKQMTGFYFAYVKAQAGWYKEFMFPFMALFRRSDFSTQFNSVYVVIVMIFLIVFRKKFSLSMTILIWINILLPMTSGSVACMPRYISILFPIYLLCGNYLITNYRTFYVSVFVLLILQLATFYPWLIYHPFSF